jgi:hypothetical protein
LPNSGDLHIGFIDMPTFPNISAFLVQDSRNLSDRTLGPIRGLPLGKR